MHAYYRISFNCQVMIDEDGVHGPPVVIELYCQPLTQSMASAEAREKEREALKRIDPYFLECLGLRKAVEEHEFGYFFKWPVNPYTQRLPNYWSVVRRPMDLKTIEHKIKAKLYSKPAEFDQDMRLMFNNAFRYNHDNHELIQRIRQISSFYEEKYNELRNRLSQEVLVREKGGQVHQERSVENGLMEQFNAKFWTEDRRKELGKRLSLISEKGRSEIRKAMSLKFSDLLLTGQNISLSALDGMQLLYLTQLARPYPLQTYNCPPSLLSKLSSQAPNAAQEQSSFQIQQSDR